MRGKIYYVLACFVTFFLAASHRSEFLWFLLGLEGMLGICLFWQVHWMGRRVSVRLRLPKAAGKKGEEWQVEVVCKNLGRLPLPETVVVLECMDLDTGGYSRFQAPVTLEEKSEAVLSFSFQGLHCGVAGIRILQVKVRDYVGIFQARGRVETGRAEFSILPQWRKEGQQEMPEAWQYDGGGEEAPVQRQKEDVGEIRDIRTFRQGDTLHRIHWKMSAKMDELLVRNFNDEMECTTLLLVDLKRQEKGLSREEWDFFLETVAALSFQLLIEMRGQYVAWYDVVTGEVQRSYVGRQEELEYMLALLLRVKLYDQGDIAVYYKEKFADEGFQEVIQINIQGEVRQQAEEAQQGA